MSTGWMVRAGRGGDHVDAFLDEGVAGIGWGATELAAKLDASLTREAIAAAIREAHPQWSAPKTGNVVGQISRFLLDMKRGDTVVTGDPETRSYFVGSVIGDPRHDATKPLPIRRPVKWSRRVPRDSLSVPALNTLGAIQSLFKLDPAVIAELETHARPIDEEPVVLGPAPRGDAEPTAVVPDELLEAPERAKAFIDDMINRLDWEQLQELVAGVLRAMGYRTRVSTPGPDRGVDIHASPDGLGLQEPRIFVEVKHREASIGAADLRAFLGGRKAGDRCLYVSTGGFKKDAKYEADRSNIPITLISLPELRALLLEHYDRADEETRALVPLRRVYLPFDPSA